MHLNKRLFFTIFALTVALHMSGLYFLHEMPLKLGTFSFKKSSFFDPTRARNAARDAALAEVFADLNEVSPDIKQELKELTPEVAPTPSFLCSLAETPHPIEALPFSPLNLPALALEMEGDLPVLPCGTPVEDLPALQQEALSYDLPLIDYAIEAGEMDSLGAMAGSEHFFITVEYAPKIYRTGYVFKVTLHPKAEVNFKRMQQNMYFLIDRSNSIPRSRFFLSKKAVATSLDLLNESDTFNILFFDDHIVRFAEKPLHATSETIAKARQFLDQQGHGGHFALTDLYASLGRIIPTDVSDTEVNAAILLSDGDTYLTLEKQRQTIGAWTARNGGKVSLFGVASGNGNNLPLLELISAFNKGALVYAPHHDQVNEKVRQLIYSLRTPIGKDMVATAVTTDRQMIVNLQPRNARLPNLYKDRPFTIWGSTNRISDFTLFLQGKYYDRHFDIMKKISFKEAKKGALSLERQWTQLVAQEFYEKYFQDGRTAHIDSAKQLLLPLNLPVPFAG